MGIFRPKENLKLTKLKEYYGEMQMDLYNDIYDTTVSYYTSGQEDKSIIKRDDITFTDFVRLFASDFFGLLTKNHDNNRMRVINNVNKRVWIDLTLISKYLVVPEIKFDKPLKEIFKDTQKDEKGRDIVCFGKYPKKAVSKEEEQNIISYGQKTNKKIHYYPKTDLSLEEKVTEKHFPIITYNNEEYVRAKALVDCGFRFSNGIKVKKGQEYYIKLEPIKWVCDYENERLVCLDGLIAGLTYSIYLLDTYNFFNVDNFVNTTLLQDILENTEVPKKEEIEVKEEYKKEFNDNILNMLRELLKMTELIKDINDRILIVEDIKTLANLYGNEMLKIKNKENSKYETERELIRNILPYYVYIEGEIQREINEDNKDKENKEIEEVINKLKERASLINDKKIKEEILNNIEELRNKYLTELYKSNKSYQKIDFSKPLEEVKTNTGEVKLTFIPSKPVLIRELVEKEIAISKRIDREINNNTFRSELLDFEELANDVVKR